MKIAVIYNKDSNNVINVFGMANQERYGKKTIGRIAEALKKFGHQVETFEGDKDLITNLEQFIPKVLKGERPGSGPDASPYDMRHRSRGARPLHSPGGSEPNQPDSANAPHR
jgi:hypothetical protein